jgi:hypothetical protein
MKQELDILIQPGLVGQQQRSKKSTSEMNPETIAEAWLIEGFIILNEETEL